MANERVRGICSVDDCGRPHNARGLCSTHYAQLRRDAESRLCTVDACGRPLHVRGLCVMHYSRVAKGRPIGSAQRLRGADGLGSVTNDGYRVKRHEGKNRLEHRIVMEAVLGRRLMSWENVHHKNGNRLDNDPTNLEIWITPQPTGQRPSDLAEWVVRNYPELVAAAQVSQSQLRLVV